MKQTKIVNGTDIDKFLKVVNGFVLPEKKKEKFNFFCSITNRNTNIPFGAGSYIGNNIIITAAHVMFKQNINNLVVRFNKKNLRHGGKVFGIKSVKIHPRYDNDTINNDIAIIYLHEDISKHNINQIYLPTPELYNYIYKKNRECVIMGYGKDNFNGNLTNKLQCSLINIMNINQTRLPPSWVNQNMVIAGDYNDLNDPTDNEDSCQGDSGGPMFGNYGKNRTPILIGIVSWGVGCAWDGFPGVYTKVGNYVKWVYKNI